MVVRSRDYEEWGTEPSLSICIIFGNVIVRTQTQLAWMVSLAGAATSIIFVTTNTCLSWQTMSFVVTKICLPQQNFCWYEVILLQQNFFVCQQVCLLQQKYAYHDKTFVATKLCLLWQIFVVTNMFVMTNKILLWQAYFCHNKGHVLSRQTHVCHNKTFVMTKMILVAAPANNRMDVRLNE